MNGVNLYNDSPLPPLGITKCYMAFRIPLQMIYDGSHYRNYLTFESSFKLMKNNVKSTVVKWLKGTFPGILVTYPGDIIYFVMAGQHPVCAPDR